MKEIKAIVQPFKLTKVRNALRLLPDFPGMTVTRVEGCSSIMQAEHDIKSELTDFSPKVRIEILAEEHQIDAIIQTLAEAAHTGQKGEGLVWVTDVVQHARISSVTAPLRE